MGVYEERTKSLIMLKCYESRGIGKVRDIAEAMICVLITNGIDIEEVPSIICDRFEHALNIKYTVEDLEAKIQEFNLNYIYPLEYIYPEVKVDDKVYDSPI